MLQYIRENPRWQLKQQSGFFEFINKLSTKEEMHVFSDMLDDMGTSTCIEMIESDFETQRYAVAMAKILKFETFFEINLFYTYEILFIKVKCLLEAHKTEEIELEITKYTDFIEQSQKSKNFMSSFDHLITVVTMTCQEIDRFYVSNACHHFFKQSAILKRK